jgi:hypothetical protein
MRKRRRILFALLALVGAWAAVAAWPDSHRSISRAGFNRLREGMTTAEVESILGPSGNFATEKFNRVYENQVFLDTPPRRTLPGELMVSWESNAASIAVFFDPGGRLNAALFCPNQPVKRDVVSQFKGWVKRQWEAWVG